jgi:hypothetical protein
MRIRLPLPVLFLVVAAVIPATAAHAATTGSLTGVVTDSAGNLLARVSVLLASPDLIGGARSTVTGERGEVVFSALPPGAYTVHLELAGYLPTEQGGIAVRLDRNTTLRVEMSRAEVNESVTVLAAPPLVDVQRVSQGQVFTYEDLQGAAIGTVGRTYQAVLNLAGGVVGTGNPNVFGSLDSENVYLIDGTNTTDPVTATFGTNFNFDAIREIALQTAGYEPEYGQAIGGVVNVVTKSGGNEFSGTADVRYSDNSFQQSGDHFDADATKTERRDASATLGGPLRRDRLWFFAAAGSTDNQRTPSLSPTTRRFEGRNYLGKLTWQAAPAWQAVVEASHDPATISNANAGRFVRPEAASKQEQGNKILQAEVSGTPARDWLLSLRASRTRQNLDAFPMSGDLERPGITDDTNGISSLNYSNAQFSRRDRDAYSATATRLLSAGWGDHEIKAGVEHDDTAFAAQNFTTGGAVYVDRSGSLRELDVSPRQPTFDFDGRLRSGYLQDSWRPTPRLTLKLGARYDEVKYRNDAGFEVADLQQAQPRLGLAWDATGDGKTVLRGSWGRFMHPNALTMPSFARSEQSELQLYLACSRYTGSREACEAFAHAVNGQPAVIIEDPLHRDPIGFFFVQAFGSASNQIQPGLEPTTANAWTLGVERQIGKATSLDISYVNKKTTDIFEDTCNGNIPTPSEDAACEFYEMANIPSLRRTYQGVVLRAESRIGDRLQLNGSYVYSKSRGNVEDTQNAGVDFDVFPDHFVNRFGYLGDDARHRAKLNGFARLPLDFSVGFNAYWQSAFPWSVTEPADLYGSRYVEPRGSRRGSSRWQIDLQLSKGFAVSGVNAQLIGAVYNVTKGEQVTGVCGTNGGCGDIPLGAATDWQQPRRFEVGVRLDL